MSILRPPSSQDQTVWTIDPSHSGVDFSVRFLKITSIKGYLMDYRGSIVLDDDDSRSAVQVTIDATSIETWDIRRNLHLRSPDFLAVAQYPTIVFTSTRVTSASAEDLRVMGDLMIREVARLAILDAAFLGREYMRSGEAVVAFEGSPIITCRDFGVSSKFAVDHGA